MRAIWKFTLDLAEDSEERPTVGFSAGLVAFEAGALPALALEQAGEACQEAQRAGRGCLRVHAGSR